MLTEAFFHIIYKISFIQVLNHKALIPVFRLQISYVNLQHTQIQKVILYCLTSKKDGGKFFSIQKLNSLSIGMSN